MESSKTLLTCCLAMALMLMLFGGCAGAWDPRRTCNPPYVGQVAGESSVKYFGNGDGHDLLLEVSETASTPSVVLTFNLWGLKTNGRGKPISGWWCRESSLLHLRNSASGRELLFGLEAIEGGRLKISMGGHDVVVLRRLGH